MIPSPLPGQPQLHYRDASLYLEDRRLSDLAREHGTPLYVYSQAAMLQALAAYQRGAELLRHCEGKLSAAQARISVLEGDVLKDLPAAES